MEGERDNAAKSAKKLKRPECDDEDEDWPLPPHQGRTFKTVEMHAGGEPLRIFRLKEPRLGRLKDRLLSPLNLFMDSFMKVL